MLGQLFRNGLHDQDVGQRQHLQRPIAVRHGFGGGEIDGEAVLPPRHRQIDFRQQFGVEQRAVQGAVGVRDVVAVTQRIERIALAGMHFLRLHQGVGHQGNMLGKSRKAEPVEFRVEEGKVERRVVDDDLRAGDVVAQFVGDFREFRLIAEEFGGQAVNRQRTLFRVAFRVDVAMKVIAGQSAVHDLDAADFDDAVAGTRVQACGFGIENDLSHIY